MDCKTFRLLNGKSEAHFLSKKNPRKFHWTIFFRRLHKKGASEESTKRKTRRSTKVQRAIVGATWEEIMARRNQPAAVRQANRDAAMQESKNKKREEETKRRAEKVKAVASAQRQAPKYKATASHGKSTNPGKGRF
jgi:large subunit ribosomal protein L24e